MGNNQQNPFENREQNPFVGNQRNAVSNPFGVNQQTGNLFEKNGSILGAQYASTNLSAPIAPTNSFGTSFGMLGNSST